MYQFTYSAAERDQHDITFILTLDLTSEGNKKQLEEDIEGSAKVGTAPHLAKSDIINHVLTEKAEKLQKVWPDLYIEAIQAGESTYEIHGTALHGIHPGTTVKLTFHGAPSNTEGRPLPNAFTRELILPHLDMAELVLANVKREDGKMVVGHEETDRIMAAARELGLAQLDENLITHVEKNPITDWEETFIKLQVFMLLHKKAELKISQ